MGATAGGADILNALIQEQRLGPWVAELDVDSDAALSGAITIDVDGVTWQGTVVRGELVQGHAHAQVMAGAGGLSQVLDAKFYLGASMRVILDDLMRASGETLASDVDSAILSYTPNRWARLRGTGTQSLRVVAEALGVAWRVRRDGKVWLGQESWPAVDIECDEIRRAGSHASITVAPVLAALAPGLTYEGRRLSSVTTYVSAEGVRQQALFEERAADERFGRVGAELASIVEGMVGARIDYARMYPAEVISQDSDGALDVIADHLNVRGTGISKVPIRHGLPGVTVNVPAGVRVLLFFEDADPQKPAAALWPDGSSVDKISITAPTVEVHGDLKVSGEVYAMAGSAQQVKLTTHKHPTAVGPSSQAIPEP